MTPVCTYTDYFVIATGQNPRQTKSIYDEVHAVLKADGRDAARPRPTASGEATWIVADYLDVVLHVFTPEARKFYDARGSVGRRAVGRARSRDRLAPRV